MKLPKVKQRPRNNKNLNLNFLDEGVFDKIGHSPYDNNDKSSVSEHNNTPQIIKISKLKKKPKKSFQEPNEHNLSRGQNNCFPLKRNQEILNKNFNIYLFPKIFI